MPARAPSPTRVARGPAAGEWGAFRGAGALPNLLMIGAAKTGTSSLHAYIAQHPDVAMSVPKELRYFWHDDWRERREWYESFFDPDKPVRGESTPQYTAWPNRDNVPERAAELVPDAKLIYVVRDPIERAASQFKQERANGIDKPFGYYVERLEEPDNLIMSQSRYATQLERWLAHYDQSQIRVIDHAELAANGEPVVRAVFEWLGVPADVPIDVEERHNTAEEKVARRRWATAFLRSRLWASARHMVPKGLKQAARGPADRMMYRQVTESAEIDAQTRRRLAEHFRPEVERLRELTGLPLAGWSV